MNMRASTGVRTTTPFLRSITAESCDMVTWGRRLSTARKRIGRRLADPRELAVVRLNGTARTQRLVNR